jgi:hypothetical protein
VVPSQKFVQLRTVRSVAVKLRVEPDTVFVAVPLITVRLVEAVEGSVAFIGKAREQATDNVRRRFFHGRLWFGCVFVIIDSR